MAVASSHGSASVNGEAMKQGVIDMQRTGERRPQPKGFDDDELSHRLSSTPPPVPFIPSSTTMLQKGAAPPWTKGSPDPTIVHRVLTCTLSVLGVLDEVENGGHFCIIALWCLSVIGCWAAVGGGTGSRTHPIPVFWLEFPAQASQAFHQSGVGELVPHLSGVNKALTCLSADHNKYRPNTYSNHSNDIPYK